MKRRSFFAVIGAALVAPLAGPLVRPGLAAAAPEEDWTKPLPIDLRPGLRNIGPYDHMGLCVIYNGERLKHCVAADPERGVALIIRTRVYDAKEPKALFFSKGPCGCKPGLHDRSSHPYCIPYDVLRGDIQVRSHFIGPMWMHTVKDVKIP